jgi:DNA-directed RNA polymerase I subunit RPA2
MLRSNRCHIENMSPHQLIQAKEESEELGGYFIVNGNVRNMYMFHIQKPPDANWMQEKIIRMLQVNRRTSHSCTIYT